MQMDVLNRLQYILGAITFNNALHSETHTFYQLKERINMDAQNMVVNTVLEMKHSCKRCLSKIPIFTNVIT